VEHAANVEGEAQRARIYSLFMQAPAAIAMVRGPTHVFEFANTRYRQMSGNRELIGKPFAEALPELVGEPLHALLDQAYESGETRSMNAAPGRLLREGSEGQDVAFFNVTYQPTRGRADEIDGILIHAIDVTEQVRGEEEQRRLIQALSRSNEELDKFAYIA